VCSAYNELNGRALEPEVIVNGRMNRVAVIAAVWVASMIAASAALGPTVEVVPPSQARRQNSMNRVGRSDVATPDFGV